MAGGVLLSILLCTGFVLAGGRGGGGGGGGRCNEELLEEETFGLPLGGGCIDLDAALEGRFLEDCDLGGGGGGG